MKLKNILLWSLFLMITQSYGQYQQNKLKYDSSQYTYKSSDKYNPTLTGVASLAIPGLGQIIAGETGRGLLFFVGSAAPIIYTIGSTPSTIVNLVSGQSSDSSNTARSLAMSAGAVIWIWSILDAVKVAKVNNMALRERKVSVDLKPAILNNNTSMVGGISLKIRLK